MSILDDAIREHLELKRAHGADDQELKRLEDEAFGPPQRPDEVDPFAEAPTEFLMSPGETAAEAPEVGDDHERSGRRPNLTDLQEAPPPEPPTSEEAAEDGPPAPADTAAGPSPAEMSPPAPADEVSPAPDAPPPSPTDAADVPLPPPPGEAPAAEPAPPTDEAPAPTDEEHPAGEHPIVPDAGPNTEERHAIADQPTQMFDVQAQMDAETAEAPAGEEESPTDEELVDATQAEPHAAPPAPEEGAAPQAGLDEQPPLESRGPDAEIAGHPPAEAEEEESAEFDFFNEQRLSDELDQALEAPLPPTDEHIAMPQYGDAPAESGVFDFESEAGHEPYEEDPSQEVLRRADAAEAAERPSEETPLDATVEAPLPAPEPPSEETPRPLEPPSEETPHAADPPSEETPRDSAEPPSEENDYDFDPDTGHEDVLEDTPRFLEDAPEDDDLWFEQKPPKDFDLD